MATTLSLILKPNGLALFFPLLQRGVQVNAMLGCDIHALLCGQFGLNPEYLSDCINTIFLNGQPVDDVTSAVVEEGATLALSAAMPGLVGATFRKAGCLAAFRGSISYRREKEVAAAGQEGCFTLKLFNMLIQDVGPRILKRGIWITGRELKDCLLPCQSDDQSIFVTIEKDGAAIDPKESADLKWIMSDAHYLLQADCSA